MDAQNLFSLMNMFNNQNQQNNQQNNQHNQTHQNENGASFNNKTYAEMYPYGEFPTNYTKEGQQQIKENLKTKTNNDAPYSSNPPQYQQNGHQNKNHTNSYHQQTNSDQQKNYNNQQFNNYYPNSGQQNWNNNTYAPQQNSSQQNGNQTASNSQNTFNNFGGANLLQAMLPLMSNMKDNNKMNNSDLMSLLMPTLSQNNPHMKDIMKMFNPTKKAGQDNPPLPKSNLQSIDSYKKIEE